MGTNSDAAVDFSGNLRDMRIYDYTKSAEQVASLYSNTNPQTPLHWWKMDDNLLFSAGTAFVENFGTGSKPSEAVRNGATYSNGTLDLDGTLTIGTSGDSPIKGFLSAPRGNLDLADNFNNSGVFTHNSGTVRTFSHDKFIQNTGTVEPVFFNLDLNNLTGQHYGHVLMTDSKNITVENIFSTSEAGALLRPSTMTMTMGTSSTAGQIITHDAADILMRNNDDTFTIQAANSLYPVQVKTNQPIAFGNKTNEVFQLNGVDYQVALDTNTGGSNASTLRLTGDCEFDAVTVSSGDTLDLNGQRAEFSGTLNIDGTLDADGLIVSSSNIDEDGGFSNAASCDMILTGATTHDLRGATHRNILINTSGTASVNAAKDLGTTPLKIGAGTFDAGQNITCGNLTVATGATYTANDDTLTVAGDFTTSGGLIGKSALTLSASVDNDSVSIPDDNTLDLTTAMTLEGWVKTTGTDSFQHIVCKSGGFYFISVNNAGGGATGKAMVRIYDGANIDAIGTSQVNDGKWHHIAGTYDTSAGKLKLYVDGKLEAETSNSDAIHTGSTNLFLGSNDATTNELTGTLARASVWNVALTPAQIREMLFYDFATADSEGTIPDANCVGWWQFDEGTGTAVADSSTSNNDGTIGTPTWAGAGTFTQGTSTVVFAKSGTQTINFKHQANDFDSLTINAGSTTHLKTIGDAGGNSLQDVNENLVVNGILRSDPSDVSRLRIRDPNATFTVGSSVRTTALANLANLVIDGNGTFNVPELTTKTINITSSGTQVSASGPLTITEELEVNSGTTFNANTNTITTREADINGSGGTLDLRNSTLSLAYSSAALRFEDNCVLLSGNSTITGLSSASKAFLRCPAAMGAELVGTLKFMNAEGGGTSTSTDITVIGPVIDCSFADSTANIRQWHHTLDTQQLLDADEAGDDDLRLTKPALDNALELQTK